MAFFICQPLSHVVHAEGMKPMEGMTVQIESCDLDCSQEESGKICLEHCLDEAEPVRLVVLSSLNNTTTAISIPQDSIQSSNQDLTRVQSIYISPPPNIEAHLSIQKRE